ncbi:TRM11 family SAM-dependent methyltransferase [Dactylosporangium sp. CA-092794]|uniref:TRM11 family SAM-dependent methyltransferase n=1 Tax=Dactylosporangium sp. CA-092794 TaxID=3239929 RepID=UPI003D93C6CC
MGISSWRVLTGEDDEFAAPTAIAQCAWVSQLRPLIAELSKPGDLVFDPFAGWGTTLIACAAEGRRGIGVEISPSRVEQARERLAGHPDQTMLCGDARTPPVAADSIDLVLTDLPYFGTALDAGSDADGTLYALREYKDYLGALDEVFAALATVLRPGGIAVVCAQNRRIADRFVPLAWDTARVLGQHLTLGDERVHLYDKAASGSDPLVTNRAHEYVLLATRN